MSCSQLFRALLFLVWCLMCVMGYGTICAFWARREWKWCAMLEASRYWPQPANYLLRAQKAKDLLLIVMTARCSSSSSNSQKARTRKQGNWRNRALAHTHAMRIDNLPRVVRRRHRRESIPRASSATDANNNCIFLHITNLSRPNRPTVCICTHRAGLNPLANIIHIYLSGAHFHWNSCFSQGDRPEIRWWRSRAILVSNSSSGGYFQHKITSHISNSETSWHFDLSGST